MLSIRAKVIIIFVLVLFLVGVINEVRKRELELKYVLAWILCDLALIVLVLFPQMLEKLAHLLGIASPMNMIFFLGFVFSLVIIYSLTVALSRVTANVRRLAQQTALQQDDYDGADRTTGVKS